MSDLAPTLFDEALIRRYDKSGPRYTSYPTAVQFNAAFSVAQYRQAALASNQVVGRRPLSLYFHLPFCNTICYYCACNKVVTKDRTKAAPYLQRLAREIELQAALFDAGRPVEQLHWGGGTPTFISHAQIQSLMEKTAQHFNLLADDAGEYSIEVDPRETRHDTIALLRAVGFNRLSLGVQDFDPQVQKAVNRVQSEAQTLAVMESARATGFKSISVDLIYGLPLQTQASFARTLEKVVAANPDRISVFNYAHMPTLFKPQRRIAEQDLPSAEEKLAILRHTIDYLGQAGYRFIGMDHFAKPADELAVAQLNGTLHRNFQGYSTHADCDLVALGITSIGRVHNSYSQNVKDLESYYEYIDAGQLAVYRGIALSDDDQLRRFVITQLICHFCLRFALVEAEFNIRFADYFKPELAQLTQLQRDGLVVVYDDRIEVPPQGRLLIRNLCMVFDYYLKEVVEQRYSKLI